jgi:hypothetical protein
MSEPKAAPVRPGWGRRRLAGALAAALLLLPVQLAAMADPLPGAGQAAEAPAGRRAEDLRARIAAIKRRLAAQREAAAAEQAVAARPEIERLSQAILELRAERDTIRGQLAAARAENERLTRARAEAEARRAALEREAAELRVVATASVNEARRLGEQLAAALGGEAPAVGELRAGKDASPSLVRLEAAEEPARAAAGQGDGAAQGAQSAR